MKIASNIRSSAITVRPRYTLCRLKSCQLMHNCTINLSHLKKLATTEGLTLS